MSFSHYGAKCVKCSWFHGLCGVGNVSWKGGRVKDVRGWLMCFLINVRCGLQYHVEGRAGSRWINLQYMCGLKWAVWLCQRTAMIGASMVGRIVTLRVLMCMNVAFGGLSATKHSCCGVATFKICTMCGWDYTLSQGDESVFIRYLWLFNSHGKGLQRLGSVGSAWYPDDARLRHLWVGFYTIHYELDWCALMYMCVY